MHGPEDHGLYQKIFIGREPILVISATFVRVSKAVVTTLPLTISSRVVKPVQPQKLTEDLHLYLLWRHSPMA